MFRYTTVTSQDGYAQAMETTPFNLHGYELAHPVYLDVPMMLNFLAHLEGGFSITESEQQTTTGAQERFRQARANIMLKIPGVGEGGLGGARGKQDRDETQTVTQTERHHTEASLFNLLYAYLNAESKVAQVNGPDDLSDLHSGQLVEISGEYLGNPIEDILYFFESLYPYVVGEDAVKDGGTKKTPAQKRRSGNPAVRATADQPGTKESKGPGESIEEMFSLIKRMAEDLRSAPVHDLKFRTEHGVDAVVTAASDYYTTTTTEHLRAGEFRVMGKVTKVLGDKDTINLTRRTVMGAARPEVATTMMDDVNKSEGMGMRVADPIVKGPAVQVLPMAIFI